MKTTTISDTFGNDLSNLDCGEAVTKIAVLTDVGPNRATVLHVCDSDEHAVDLAETVSDKDVFAHVPLNVAEGDRVWLEACEVIDDIHAEIA